jgi:rhodanese-related sulfurtransferase
MKLTSVLLFFSFALTCCSQPSTVETISPQEFANRLKATPDPQLLDVRTPQEYSGEHLENSDNVNWNDADFATKASTYDKSKPIFVYCKVGGRSGQAAEKLHEMGFTKVYNMDGGILKWNSANLGKTDDKRVGMTKSEFDKLIASDKKVLVNFSAEWCAPCKKMKPFLLAMQDQMKDEVKIIRLDADANKTLMSEMGIDELPALLLYENQEMKWQHNGFISEEDLKKQL